MDNLIDFKTFISQGNFADYFLGTREEKFFFAIKNRMLMSTVATKEKWVMFNNNTLLLIAKL